jgi:biofilm PGA synthesis protein PgaA
MKRKIIAVALLLPAGNAFAKLTDEALYRQALQQAREGQFVGALPELERLASEHPNRKKYLYDYLQVLSWANRDDDVLIESEKLDLQRAPAFVLEAIAKAARNKGQLEKANELYARAAEKTPKRLTPHLGLGLVMLDQKQTQAAISHFEQLSENFPDNPELNQALANALLQDGQTARADQLLKSLLTSQPDNKDAVVRLVQSQIAKQDFAGAIATANAHRQQLSDEDIARLNWEHASWLVRQGEIALETNPQDFAKTEQAIDVLKNNLSILATLNLTEPKSWQTRAEADLLVALHDRQQMKQVIDRFQQADQAALPIYAKAAAANAYLADNQPQKAQALLSQIVASQPENYFAWQSLANISFANNDKDALNNILPRLKHIVDSHPDKPHYRFDYLQFLQWSGQNAQVLTEAESIDLANAPAYALETIAKAARELHQFSKAEELYRLAAEKTPERLTPRLGLGLLMLDKHESKSAARYFDDLAKTSEENPDVLWAQAQAHEMAGHAKQASQLYQKILSSQPHHKEATRGLIRTLAAAGSYGQALKIARQHRSLVTDDLWAELNWQHAAGLLRHGEKILQTQPDDFRTIDQALQAIDTNLASLPKLKLADKEIWRNRALADRLVALRDRQRYADLDADFQTAQAQQRDLPNYALLAVADGYLKSQKPAAARDVYLQSLDNEPNNLDALVGLVRIYLEIDQKPAIEPILSHMQTLAEQHPKQPRYRHELLQTLAWLERDPEALQQAQQIDMATAPIYVLETAGRSARNMRDFALAETLFQQAAARDPQRLTPKLAQAWLLLDQQKNIEAITYLQQLRESFPNSVELLLTQANAHSFAGQHLEAVAQYQHALEIAPTQPEAQRGLAFSLANADKVEQALVQANSHRPLFSDEEWTGLKWRHAAELIRQGEQALSVDARDYRATDQAISELQENIDLTRTLQLPDPTLWRQRAQFDLLVALRDRRRMADTISLYQQLLQQQTALPVYARMAAADAYLNNRNPQQASDLYLGVLQEVPDYFNAKASLAYAYLEAEQLDLALQTAENLADEQPETITSRLADGSETQIANPNKVNADLLAALFPAYVDDLKTAQTRLEQLHLQHPDNTNIHSKLAEIYYYRGWPRRAQREIEQAQAKSPEHFGLKLTQAKVAHELRDYPQEAAITYDLYRDYPEDSGAIKQMQAWKKHNKPELKIFANGGVSKNEQSSTAPLISNDEINLDSIAYSQPIAKNYRIFAHNGWRSSSFKEGSKWVDPDNQFTITSNSDVDPVINANNKLDTLNTAADLLAKRNWKEAEAEIANGYLRHYGIGLEYSQDNAKASAEVHYDNSGTEKIGLDLDLEYQFNDYWQLYTHLSSLDNNIPVRALKHGVTAKSAHIGFSFKPNESRQFNLTTHYTHFNSAKSSSCNSINVPEITYNGTTYSAFELSSEQICSMLNNINSTTSNNELINDIQDLYNDRNNIVNTANSLGGNRSIDEIWLSPTLNDFLKQTPLITEINSSSNNRYAIDGSYLERWHSGPIYKFSTIIGASFSANSSSNVFYYSPKKDATLALTLDNDWLTYRNYETDFHQRLAVTAGNYWQENFGSNMVGNIQYEHRWRLGNDIELNYGAVRSYRFYDDALTENWQMYMTADIRF